jgi:hypothetical protein
MLRLRSTSSGLPSRGRRWESGGGDVREKVRASDEDRYFFFFVKAGPKSGFTWQLSTLPTHIESS